MTTKVKVAGRNVATIEEHAGAKSLIRKISNPSKQIFQGKIFIDDAAIEQALEEDVSQVVLVAKSGYELVFGIDEFMDLANFVIHTNGRKWSVPAPLEFLN